MSSANETCGVVIIRAYSAEKRSGFPCALHLLQIAFQVGKTFLLLKGTFRSIHSCPANTGKDSCREDLDM